MSGRVAVLVVAVVVFSVGSANAQESNAGPGPGFVEVTYIPAGAAFFTSKGTSPASATTASARPSRSMSTVMAASRASWER